MTCNRSKLFYIFLGFLTFMSSGFAAEGDKLPISIFNRIRLEYDDNIYQEKTNKDDSFKIVEQIEFIKNIDFEDTFIGLRYNPSFVWWDNRNDDFDIHHQVDASLNHDFSPRFTVNLKETFRRAELPRFIENGVVVREKNNYNYNSVSAGVGYGVSENIQFSLDGRYENLKYDDNDVSRSSDYDKSTVGADLGYRILPDTLLSAQVRWSDISYDDSDRNSDSTQVGLALKSIITPKLEGNLRAGFEYKNLDNANKSSVDSPYGSASLTYTPAYETTFNMGVSYSPSEAAFSPYVNQERVVVFGGLSKSITASLSAHLSASFSNGNYDKNETERNLETEDQSIELKSGDENFSQISANLVYKLNHIHSMDIGWQYLNLDSDISKTREYDRNRFHVGWKAAF